VLSFPFPLFPIIRLRTREARSSMANRHASILFGTTLRAVRQTNRIHVTFAELGSRRPPSPILSVFAADTMLARVKATAGFSTLPSMLEAGGLSRHYRVITLGAHQMGGKWYSKMSQFKISIPIENELIISVSVSFVPSFSVDHHRHPRPNPHSPPSSSPSPHQPFLFP